MPVKHLTELSQTIRETSLSSLATARVEDTALSAAGWQIDLSRHYLTSDVGHRLNELAEARGVTSALAELFDGAIVNPSENRPALHWALRSQSEQDGEAEVVRQSAGAALELARRLASGDATAANGEPFEAIVHIGIGGSDFGPRLVADAFGDMRLDTIDLRFCANLDPLDLELALSGLNPARTLVIGISKSFGTEETLYNLSRGRDWLKASLGADWPRHLALVTANPARAKAWLDGGDGALLHLPESVGGRFSIWSAGSLACMTALEGGTFDAFLAGAAHMDEHVRTAPLASNAAAQLALLDVWNASFMGFGSRAVLAYSRRLKMLPTYLQQLEMESNGKSVQPDGLPSSLATAPLLWGGEGTIGQHSYHQWLHQGTHIVPTEFILAPGSLSDAGGVDSLTAHALAQAEVLANGRSLAEVKAEEPGLESHIAAQKVHAGGRPSTLMHTKQLTPHALGALIALYEHRTYVAGILWGVNSFDQWGVERGKTMAARLKPVLSGEAQADDPVTGRLVKQLTS